jgi:hypothetical protein
MPRTIAARGARRFSRPRSVGTQITREVMRNIFGGMSRWERRSKAPAEVFYDLPPLPLPV